MMDPVALAYDAVGRLITDPTASNVGDVSTNGQRYVYSSAGRMLAPWRTNGTATETDDDLLLEIGYDALGRRVQSTMHIDANTGGVLAEPAVTWHVYDGLQPIEAYAVSSNGVGGWTFTDGNGEPWTDSAYGNPWMWTGQRYDAVTGQYHFWARTYSPTLGRWLQRDPLGYVDGVSLYEYAVSDPIGWVDPLGLNYWSDLHFRLNEMRVAKGQPPEPYVDVGASVSSLRFAGVAAWTPGVGDANDIGTITTGYDALSGEQVGTGGRIITAGAVIVGSGKAWREAAEKVGDAAGRVLRKIPNPFGSKGKPDNQAAVKALAEKAEKEFPGHEIVTEKGIRIVGSNRRPDVQVINPETGKTVKVYEAERHPGSKRNRDREAEYDELGIDHETHPVGPSSDCP